MFLNKIMFKTILHQNYNLSTKYLSKMKSFLDNNELYTGVYGFGGSLGFFEDAVFLDCEKSILV